MTFASTPAGPSQTFQCSLPMHNHYILYKIPVWLVCYAYAHGFHAQVSLRWWCCIALLCLLIYVLTCFVCFFCAGNASTDRSVLMRPRATRKRSRPCLFRSLLSPTNALHSPSTTNVVLLYLSLNSLIVFAWCTIH